MDEIIKKTLSESFNDCSIEVEGSDAKYNVKINENTLSRVKNYFK